MPFSQLRPTVDTLGVSRIPPVDREFGEKYVSIEYPSVSPVTVTSSCYGDNIIIVETYSNIPLGSRILNLNILGGNNLSDDYVVIEQFLEQLSTPESYVYKMRLNKPLPSFTGKSLTFVLDQRAIEVSYKILPLVLDQYKFNLKLRYAGNNYQEFPFRSIIRGDFESKHFGTVSQNALDKLKKYLVENVLSYRGEKCPYHLWKKNLETYVKQRILELEKEKKRWTGENVSSYHFRHFTNSDFFNRTKIPIDYTWTETYGDSTYDVENFRSDNHKPLRSFINVEGKNWPVIQDYIIVNGRPYNSYIPERDNSINSPQIPNSAIIGTENTVNEVGANRIAAEIHEGDAFYVDAVHNQVSPVCQKNPLITRSAVFKVSQSGTEYTAIDIVDPGKGYEAGDVIILPFEEIYTIHLSGKKNINGIPVEVEPNIPLVQTNRSFIYDRTKTYSTNQLVYYQGQWYKVLQTVKGIEPGNSSNFERYTEGNCVVRIKRQNNQNEPFTLIDIVRKGKGYEAGDSWQIPEGYLGGTFCNGVNLSVSSVSSQSDGEVLAVTLNSMQDNRYWDLRCNRDLYQLLIEVKTVDDNGGILDFIDQHPEDITDYDPEKEYKIGQIVKYNDVLFKCALDHKGVIPTDRNYFERIREKVFYQKIKGQEEIQEIDYSKRWVQDTYRKYWDRPREKHDTPEWKRYSDNKKWIGNARAVRWYDIQSEIISPGQSWNGPIFHVTKVGSDSYHLDIVSGSAARGTVLRIRGVVLDGKSPRNDLYILVLSTENIGFSVISGSSSLQSFNTNVSATLLGGDINATVSINRDFSTGSYSLNSLTPGTGYSVGDSFVLPGSILGGFTPEHDCTVLVTGLIYYTLGEDQTYTLGEIETVSISGTGRNTFNFYGSNYQGAGANIPFPSSSLSGSWYTEKLGEDGEFDLYFPEYPGNNYPELDNSLPKVNLGGSFGGSYNYLGMLEDLIHHVSQLRELKYDYSNFDDVLMRDWLYLKVSGPLIEPKEQAPRRNLQENNVLFYIPTLAETGLGKDLLLHIQIQSSSITKNNVIIVEKGTNYKVGDLVTVNGHFLGGEEPAQQLKLKIKNIDRSGGVTDFDIVYTNVINRRMVNEVISRWPYYNEIFFSYVNPYVSVPEYQNDVGYSRMLDTYLLFVLDRDVPDDPSNPDFCVRDKWKIKAENDQSIEETEGADNKEVLSKNTTGPSKDFAEGRLKSPFSAEYQFYERLLIHTDRPQHGYYDPRIVSGIEYLPKHLKGQPNENFFTEFKFTPVRLMLSCQREIRGETIFYMDSCTYDHKCIFIFQRKKMIPCLMDNRLTFYKANTGSPNNSVTQYYGKRVSKEFPDVELDLT